MLDCRSGSIGDRGDPLSLLFLHSGHELEKKGLAVHKSDLHDFFTLPSSGLIILALRDTILNPSPIDHKLLILRTITFNPPKLEA